MYPFNERQFSRRLWSTSEICLYEDGIQEDTVTASTAILPPTTSTDNHAPRTSTSAQNTASHDRRLASGYGFPITDNLPVAPCIPLTSKSVGTKRSRTLDSVSSEPVLTSDEDVPASPDPEPVARIISYKGRGDQGDFCVFTLYSSLTHDFPPPMADIRIKTADLFAQIHPETGEMVMWMRNARDVWAPIEEGAPHPTMSHRCLHVKKSDGSGDPIPNWVLRDTIRKYKQQALRDSRLREVSITNLARAARCSYTETALYSTE